MPALQARAKDRFYDPACAGADGEDDPTGVAEAHLHLRTAYGIIDREMARRHRVAGDGFTPADCTAAPALYDADLVSPLRPDFPRAADYLDRLKACPSFTRILAEAEPYRHFFPGPRGGAPRK